MGIREALAALTFAMTLIAPDIAQAARAACPKYVVKVSLTEKAARKLKASGETVHISAMYYGEASPGFKGDDMGEIQLGTQDVDINGAGQATLGGIIFDSRKVAQIVGKSPQLLINVYTSRKIFENNLLDCDIFQDKVTIAARGPIAIACKLIGE